MRILLFLLFLTLPFSLFAQSENQPDGYEDVTVTVTSGIVTMRGTTLDSEKIA